MIAHSNSVNKMLNILFLTLLVPAESLVNYQRLNGISNKCMRTKPNHCNLQMRLNPTSFEGTDFTITEFPRPSLRRVPNAPIVEFGDSFQAKAEEMLGVMYEAKGVGIAAPQVGLNEGFFVYNPFDSKDMARIVCNPTITKYSKEVTVEEEGCLSLRSDDCSGQVSRSNWIETEYQNELGQKVRRRLKDFEARVFQHEYDHLKGILCYDRFPPEDREAVQKNIDMLMGLYDADDASVELDAATAEAMQPRPLSAKWMPPLDVEEIEEEAAPKKKKASKPSGAGGFGAGGGGSKTKKKDKKKKVKTRNALRSSDPRFKSRGKSAFASRK
mmetsp:Transcript_11548/g.17865  ORF Transcript_11548/g.17865 Transcript_11548/m.17865 type:complete len:328 (+) Transcript_11548:3-986(+)